MRSKLRIAIVTTHPPGSGSLNEYAYHFVRNLRQKHSVGAIYMLVDELPDGQSYDEFEDLDMPFDASTLKFVPCWRFNALNNAPRILRAVQSIQPDIVFFNLQFATFGSGKVAATLGLMAPAMLKMAGFKTAVLLHNILETVDLRAAGYGMGAMMERVTRLAGTWVMNSLLSADMVSFTIPKYVEIIEEKYGVDVFLTPHGSFEGNFDAEPPTTQLPDGPMQIMTFGKFGTYKKVELLVEAFIRLTDEGRDLELVIAGADSPNSQGYLASVQKKYAHVPNIRFTGYVAEADVPVIFGEAAVVVFPYTSTTGSSGVLHQAGDYAKAVVLPNIGDFAEVISDEGYTGEFFEVGKVKSLAKAIAAVIDDPARREEIGRINYAASCGIPIKEVVDWYLLQWDVLLSEKQQTASLAGQAATAKPAL